MGNETTSGRKPRRASEENALWHLGNLVHLLVTGDDTDGRVALFELRVSRGSEPPGRIHHEEDEIVYVIEGCLTYLVDEERYELSSGAALMLPRGVERCFRVDSDEARLLVMAVPAGLEGYFREVGTPASNDVADDGALRGPIVIERLVTVAARYGIEIVGPPSGAPHDLP